jgi:hypothetical protein
MLRFIKSIDADVAIDKRCWRFELNQQLTLLKLGVAGNLTRNRLFKAESRSEFNPRPIVLRLGFEPKPFTNFTRTP